MRVDMLTVRFIHMGINPGVYLQRDLSHLCLETVFMCIRMYFEIIHVWVLYSLWVRVGFLQFACQPGNETMHCFLWQRETSLAKDLT